MARPGDSGVPIQLDKPRHLIANLNALAAYEEVTGQSITEIGVTVNSAKGVRALLWGLLLTEDPALTLAEAGAMVDLENVEMVKAKINEALMAGRPDPAQAEGASKNPVGPRQSGQARRKGASPTGTGSGPSGSTTSD